MKIYSMKTLPIYLTSAKNKKGCNNCPKDKPRVIKR